MSTRFLYFISTLMSRDHCRRETTTSLAKGVENPKFKRESIGLNEDRFGFCPLAIIYHRGEVNVKRQNFKDGYYFLQVFDELLLDADWSVNAGSWMWYSCSSFFQELIHCYCPVGFGRKVDPNGDYIRSLFVCRFISRLL